ncbi:glycoside hydrolase family 15 protein [Baekduia soli]|uniref:Glycoside hydrolase family 15 protein n=1 Tax=Baekduia soli TaxID=496014 RepID=A0A5B8U0A0_9ACTN|nr:glycoside hydrolase family 15 protein [Baekduia soli]QEC46406.1 glycoside hydrolase family 15 protein [Baekduia soli]
MTAPTASQTAARAQRPHVLREYALLADGERGVLVGPRGDFVWMCFPRWDSGAVFSSLIGGSGAYAVTPRDRCVWGGYYEPGSLIWRSRWVTDDATIECREALALPTRPDRAVILRRVIARQGTARVDVVLDPRGDFGKHALRRLSKADDGTWTGELDGAHLCWVGGQGARPQADGHGGKALTLTLELAEGAHHDFVLVLAAEASDCAPPDPEWAWQGVEAAWRDRVPELERTSAPRDSRHSYAVLSGLTSAGGGMVAAATTSLPERARQGRNYDYRYVWIRDQCYAGQAVAKAGPYPLMDDAVRFVAERLLADGPQLKPAYTTTGAAVPDQRQLDLPGYPGGSDIVGNWVNGQFQLDGFGEALLLFAAAARHDHLDADGWRAAESAIGAIEQRWREPDTDAGIWEIDPDAWTHSRLICAAGLRQIAQCGPGGEQAARWVSLADMIVSDTAAHAVHPSGRWQRSPGDVRVDAALLLPAIRGAIPASDPRSIATLQAVASELTQDGYCYRYRPDERPLGTSEGAFLLCGFLMSLAYTQQGDHVSAARWFERNRAASGPPGLYSEEFDVTQRQLRGNLPQAFVHALMLECALTQYGDLDLP